MSSARRRPTLEGQPLLERPRRKDEAGRSPGGPACVPASIAPCSAERGGREGGGNHLAVGEGLGPGDVVEVLVAEHDDEAPHALGLQRLADEARVLDRDVRVVDERLVAVDDRVAGDAEPSAPSSTQLGSSAKR